MTNVVTKEATDEMALYRQDALDRNFPQLKREDFADDVSYRQALVEQYRALRQQEFGYVVYNEAMKAYNVASEANAAKRSRTENTSTGAWSGYKQRPEARDSSFVNVPQMVEIGKTPNSGESCAISANALTLEISNEMGYTGKDNLIVPKSRVVVLNGKPCVTSNNNLSSAACIHMQDSIPKEYRLSFGKGKKPTLNEAIKQGLVNAGDEISVVTGSAQGSTTSGCHAMVVVDVQKDDSGKVTNYTLQCNNPPCLKVVDANNPDYYGKCPLNSAIMTSKWIDNKISSEIPDDMTIEELEKKVSNSRYHVSAIVDNVHATELHYVEHKHYNDKKPVGVSVGFGEHYNDEVSKARAEAQALAATQADMGQVEGEQTQNTDPSYTPVQTEEGQPALTEVTSAELRQQQGELAEDKSGREGATVALKSGPMEKGVAYHEAVQDLSKEDGRPVEQALREDSGEKAVAQPVSTTKTQSNGQSPGYRIVRVDNAPTAAKQNQPQSAQPSSKVIEMTPEQIQVMIAQRKRQQQK